jgi:hypothetical protein
MVFSFLNFEMNDNPRHTGPLMREAINCRVLASAQVLLGVSSVGTPSVLQNYISWVSSEVHFGFKLWLCLLLAT